MPGAKLARGVVIAYLLATALHIAYVVAHEPFCFDAWNVAVDTRSRPASIGDFFAYWHDQYTHSNPRLGQPITYLAYKLVGVAEVLTPLAYLALTLAIVVIALRRLPRDTRDLALWAIVVGIGWFALPDIGRTLLNRAYSANYVYGAAIQLWFVAWLRLAADERPEVSQLLTFGAFGTLAGMCNEHTGPALVGLTLGHALWQRKHGASPRLAVAGAISALLGVLAILLAPGQNQRYGGLVQRTGLLDVMRERGITGEIEIAGDYVLYATPILAVVGVVWLVTRGDASARRSAGRLVGVGLAAGIIVVGTLWASPKLGPRFFIAPIALLLAGAIAVLDAARVRLHVFVVAAVLASGYAAARTIPLYRRLSAQSDARLATLASSAPGSALVVEPFEQVSASRWFMGDDFRTRAKRRMVARYLALEAVKLRSRR